MDPAKAAKARCRIYEVPISYHGRDYSQGKKIGWKDGVRALWCLVKYSVEERALTSPQVLQSAVDAPGASKRVSTTEN